jgi:hypothetical protein
LHGFPVVESSVDRLKMSGLAVVRMITAARDPKPKWDCSFAEFRSRGHSCGEGGPDLGPGCLQRHLGIGYGGGHGIEMMDHVLVAGVANFNARTF